MSRSLRRQIGQLIMAGFPGRAVTPELRSIARQFDLGGVILFDRNIEAAEQVGELAWEAQSLSSTAPVWVSVDQEGGRVARLRAPFTVWPAMRSIGRSGDVQLAARFARAMARELAAVGISLDYAPVLDVDTNARNPIIGDRALSSDAHEVGRLGAVIIDALQAEGVAACAKHFPGHGDTDRDSHQVLPVVEHPLERLREVELEPFRTAIARNVAVIMTAHVRYPALDEDKPATMSHEIVTALLRQEMAFQGIIATDDMYMRAVTAEQSVTEASVEAVRAGCDMVLLCADSADDQVAVLEAMIRDTEADPRFARGVERAIGRHLAVKGRFLAARPERHPRTARELRTMLGSPEHAAIAEEMARFL